MRILLAALLCLPALAAAAEPPSPPLELTLQVLPETPRPGQRVYWLGRLRNASQRTLHVPTQTSEWLCLDAYHAPPNTAHGHGHGHAFAAKQPPLAWRDLAPGEAIEVGGDVGDVEPACRRGCPAGNLQLQFELAVPPGLPADVPSPDHVLPRNLRTAEGIRIGPSEHGLLERTAPGAVAARILRARQGKDGLRLRVELTNRTDVPLRLPPFRYIEAACEVAAPGQTVAVAGVRGGDAVTQLDAGKGVLLAAGRARTGDLDCPGALLPKPGSVLVRLTAPAWLSPSRPLAPPHVWAGTARSAAFAVGLSSQH